MAFQFPYRIKRQKIGGFTLVELLVVISIIGLLISLLLPAIQATREAARRMSCKNNLHQLSLAVISYENSKGIFPPACLVKRSGNYVDLLAGPRFSWIVTILPFMEDSPLYKQFDFKKTVFDQSGNPQAAQLESLMCPTDAAQGRFFSDSRLTNGKRFGKGNYAAFVSPYHTDLQLEFPGALIATGQAAKKVHDGLSRTMMLTEVRTRRHEQDQRGAWRCRGRVRACWRSTCIKIIMFRRMGISWAIHIASARRSRRTIAVRTSICSIFAPISSMPKFTTCPACCGWAARCTITSPPRREACIRAE